MISVKALKHTVHGAAPIIGAARALGSSPVSVVAGRGGRSSVSSHTVTVFGATSGMGRYLVNNLGQMGTQMVIPHRCDPYTVQYLKVSSDLGQVHFVYTPDFNDQKALEECVKYSDVVVNLTGTHRQRLHHSMTDSNVTLTHRIARACKNMGVPSFIHMSHVSANHDSISQFLQTKALSEEVVLHELPDAAIIVRLADCFHAYDNFSHYYAHNNSKHRQISRGFTRLYKEGLEHFKQPVYGGDVMRALKNIILMNDEDRQRLYQFVGPKLYSVHDLCEEITKVTLRDFKPAHSQVEYLVNRFLLHNDQYIRYQCCSDIITPGLPGLEDVGVTARSIEDIGIAWLRNYRNFWRVWDPMDGRRSTTSGNAIGTGEIF